VAPGVLKSAETILIGAAMAFAAAVAVRYTCWAGQIHGDARWPGFAVDEATLCNGHLRAVVAQCFTDMLVTHLVLFLANERCHLVVIEVMERAINTLLR